MSFKTDEQKLSALMYTFAVSVLLGIVVKLRLIGVENVWFQKADIQKAPINIFIAS